MTNQRITFQPVILGTALVSTQVQARSKEIWQAAEELARQAGFPYPPAVTFQIAFSVPVTLRRSKSSVIKTQKVCLRLFLPAATSGYLCYTLNRRKGYMFLADDLFAIESIEIAPEDRDESTRVIQVKRLARIIHPNAWASFVEELQSPDAQKRYAKRGLSRVDIRKLLPPSVVAEVEKAFDTRTKYHYRHPGERRNWIVEVSPGDDGVLRAWFNSYHKDAAHGNEYLLLNPHIASFMERD